MFNHRVVLLGVLASLAMTSAPAFAQAPAQNPFVSSNPVGGLRYVGNDANNDVRITFAVNSGKFTVDDVVPLTPGLGCELVAGDATKVTCLAPKAGNKLMEFRVITGNGNDKVVNATSTTSVLGAPMQANGGAGNDVLIGDLRVDDALSGSSGNDELRAIGGLDELDGGSGDDKVLGGVSSDVLEGGSGNDLLDGGGSDDVLKGGNGRDIIDGGPAGISVGERHDRVVYSDHVGSVRVDLTRTDASQGTQANPALGILAENDTILDVEDIVSGGGADFLTGNAFANTISGGAGNDIINGREGRDVLVGDDGADFISPSPAPQIVVPIGVVPDGQPDAIECGSVGRSDGDPGDVAFRVLTDGDVTNDCASVFNQ